LELVGYPGHAGGISNIATVLAELSENMDADVLCKTAKLCPASWAQRLGYLLEKAEASALADSLFSFVKTEARSYTPLRRAAKTTVVERVARWKLIVNTEVEPDE
jgi:predicted transcriptional regulator of viral defense system